MRRLLETDYTDANAIGGEFDYYPTPMWAVSVIIPHIAKRRNGSFVIIDPGAGIGNVSIVAAKSSLIVRFVHGIEVHPERAELCKEAYDKELPNIPHNVTTGDFLSPIAADRLRVWASEFNSTPLLIGNPAYSKPRPTIGMEFVEQALKIASPRGIVAFLMQLEFASGVERANRIHDNYKCSCYVLRRRPSFGATGNSSTGQRSNAWFVWDLANMKQTEFRVL